MNTQDFKSNSDFAVNEGEVQVDTDYYNDSHDAARYRWLRANTKELVLKGNKPGESFIYGSDYDPADLLDKSIDAAMANLVADPQMTSTEVMQRMKDA